MVCKRKRERERKSVGESQNSFSPLTIGRRRRRRRGRPACPLLLPLPSGARDWRLPKFGAGLGLPLPGPTGSRLARPRALRTQFAKMRRRGQGRASEFSLKVKWTLHKVSFSFDQGWPSQNWPFLARLARKSSLLFLLSLEKIRRQSRQDEGSFPLLGGESRRENKLKGRPTTRRGKNL